MPRELPKDQKVAFEMTAGDHTELIQFAIRHRGKVSARDQRTKADLLRRFEVLAKHDKTLAPKFANAAVAVQEAEQTIEKIPKVELEKVVPIVTAVARARDMGELRQVINTEASKQEHSEAIKVGLRTAGELLDRGRDTIYSHHFWMQAFIDPREILGHLGHAGSLLHGLGEKILEVAKKDVTGAVSGAVTGAAAGAATGGQAGALKGAVGGSVSGAIANSADAVAS